MGHAFTLPGEHLPVASVKIPISLQIMHFLGLKVCFNGKNITQ
jgi:hypothetical protein